MSSDGHSAMTGAPATIDPQLGGAFEEWDGYIAGRTLLLESGRRIVQSWRTGPVTQSYPIEASWATRIRSGSPMFPICLIARDTVRPLTKPYERLRWMLKRGWTRPAPKDVRSRPPA